MNRNLTVRLNYLLDELIPPFLRDQRWFMAPLIWLIFRKKAGVFLGFKKKALKMSKEDFARVYREISGYEVQRATDLNDECIKAIPSQIRGQEVLEVGSGKGFLAMALGDQFNVTAVDVAINNASLLHEAKVHFQEGNAEALPFPDKSFDTVICAHTLEHVQDIFKAISELRRVARQRLIIVVPKERPYKYTPNLHLHFFPYAYSLLTLMGSRGLQAECNDVGGDWLYIENCQERSPQIDATARKERAS